MSVKILQHQPSLLVCLSRFLSLSLPLCLSVSLPLSPGNLLSLSTPLPSHQPAAVKLSLLTLSKEPATLHFNDLQDKENEAALGVAPSPGNELVAHKLNEEFFRSPPREMEKMFWTQDIVMANWKLWSTIFSVHTP